MNRVQYMIKNLTKEQALEMVKLYHYSNTLPKLNKHFIGFYLNDVLVGVTTLGWGTRPMHTIKKVFPSLESKDYLEIGRMCMTDEMPRNSESQMLSQLIKWVRKNLPEIKVLFTWADGMLGKVGYVHQASNFLYAGFSETDFYMKDGIKIHPRQTKALFASSKNDKRITARPSHEQCLEHGILHYKGRQFRYTYFVCSKRIQKALRKECLVPLTRDYPKEDGLKWRVKNINKKWVNSSKPQYKTDIDIKSNKLFNLNN